MFVLLVLMELLIVTDLTFVDKTNVTISLSVIKKQGIQTTNYTFLANSQLNTSIHYSTVHVYIVVISVKMCSCFITVS